jgi:hypothetical protein
MSGSSIGPDRPGLPSYNTRKKASDAVNKASGVVESIGQVVDTPGLGAALTLSAATAVLPVGGPQVSGAVIASYPAVEFSIMVTSYATNLISTGLNNLSSWFINP